MEKLCCALIFSVSFLFAQQYIVSYQAKVRDAYLINESFYVSAAMVETKKEPQASLTLNANTKNVQKLFSKNRDELLDFLFKSGVHLKSEGLSENAMHTSLTTLYLPSTYLKVEFNNQFANITLLK